MLPRSARLDHNCDIADNGVHVTLAIFARSLAIISAVNPVAIPNQATTLVNSEIFSTHTHNLAPLSAIALNSSKVKGNVLDKPTNSFSTCAICSSVQDNTFATHVKAVSKLLPIALACCKATVNHQILAIANANGLTINHLIVAPSC